MPAILVVYLIEFRFYFSRHCAVFLYAMDDGTELCLTLLLVENYNTNLEQKKKKINMIATKFFKKLTTQLT